jgi:cation transport ATPase
MERESEYDRTVRVEPEDRTIPVEPEPRVVRVREEEPDTRQPITIVEPNDRVRWGPIWAGLITAITAFLLLELLMYTLGLLTVNISPDQASSTGPWVTAIVGLVAFFLGGWVAGATSAVRGTAAGLLNGFLVWGLGTVLILVLSTFGLGQLFGAVGSAISQFLALGNPNFNLQLGNIDPAQIARMVRDAAMWALISLAVSALACMLGGWVGVKSGPIGQIPQETRKG